MTPMTPQPAVLQGATTAQAPRALPSRRRSDALVPVRRAALRVTQEWLPYAVWAVAKTGRTGLVGLVLLLTAGVFFASTELPVAREVATLRNELVSAARHQASAPRAQVDDVARALKNLPKRAEMPAILGVLLKQADESRLTLDTGKYESSASKSGEITRYRVSFPVVGPYPQIRQFIDATLSALPAAAISELSIERKTIGDSAVEAQIRLTVFTRSAP